ncbi:NADP-dependent 3-hydroxy acid dehydrogenase YdfG [Paraoerskovia marina]|uniref:NADP-dependent 3-hydroxy acid dehydrogenase YdfG n=1 Tax=Paraoerskovia marina TaxID=545619 RepID=A0A1H1TKJ5_9CELL|nr:SDR family oxidoreductase [Paraoerskovia marina]SDS60835.1 NADP-dependent 3-hydroxy acid dehydrogenase YdfG [Paraoerskovia marina]
MTARPVPGDVPAWTDPGAVPPARTVLVTGATRGIGRAVAEGLAVPDGSSDTHAVALLGRDAQRVHETVESVRETTGASVIGVVADVLDRAAVAAAVARVEEAWGGVDLLVNNAGVIDAEVPLWEADPDEWWHVVETNLRGAFEMSRAVVPGMIARGGGRVVDLASGASTHEMVGSSAYNASKTALVRMGAHLHAAGAPHGLRVFEVSPGSVRTDMTAAMPLHANRTEWTPVEDLVEMVRAIARGELDDWSGAYLRVTHDDPRTLSAAAAAGRAVGDARRLRVRPWGDDDPMPAGLPPR